jgi:ArsR family transcriptional regulator, arsenate/arsenite/antimonite-responsive transcriptional repressor
MDSKEAVSVLGALAQETRLAIYRMLVEQAPVGMAAGRIGGALKLAPATLSFHLRELSRAGLILAKQQSRFIYYSADLPAMSALLGYLATICGRADAAGAAVEVSIAAPRAAGSVRPAGASTIKPAIHPKTRAA